MPVVALAVGFAVLAAPLREGGFTGRRLGEALRGSGFVSRVGGSRGVDVVGFRSERVLWSEDMAC